MKFSSIFLIAAVAVSSAESRTLWESLTSPDYEGPRHKKSVKRHAHAFEKMMAQSQQRAKAGAQKTDDFIQN
jgi:hypothetical protein